MAYYALVTEIENVRRAEGSDRLYLGDCFGEGVIVGPDMASGTRVLYLPSDGQIERWFGNEFNLFRKNEDGTDQGGYIENNGHIRAIKLRGNQSSGVVIALSRIYEKFGFQHWENGAQVNEINGKSFCCKYVPHRQVRITEGTPKTSKKGKKLAKIVYPEFDMHIDTEQLMYNLDKFKLGDEIHISLKLHGTSQRSMRTYAELPRGFFRRLFRMKPKTKDAYVLGTRRCVVEGGPGGYYGNDEFRLQHHKRIKEFVEPGMEVFYEVVGYYGSDASQTIMPSVDCSKMGKDFVKKYGKRMQFTYGNTVGQSSMWVYRITANNGKVEYTPRQIQEWCRAAGVYYVPWVEDIFFFTTKEDLLNRINKYFEDMTDPVGQTHIKEGVVVRIVNRPRFAAYKHKLYEFKVLSGIAVENANTAGLSQDIVEEM